MNLTINKINKIGVAALLIILPAIVYFNAIKNPFQFDDFHHVRDNPAIRSIKNIPSFFVDVKTFSERPGRGHYRPLLLATHAINYASGGLNPVGYHLVNLAFHAGSAFLIFLIVQAMLGSSEQAAGSRLNRFSLPTTYIPLASALIFAVHPFNSEVVNYISARSSVMSGFFYLLAFWCWVKYRQAAGGIKGTGSFSTTYYLLPTTYFYISSLLAFLLGMLTKEIVITLPVVLWLYDLYFVSGIHATKESHPLPSIRRLIVYLPFIFFVALPYVLLRTYLIGTMLSPSKPPRDYYVNFLTETKVLVTYLKLMCLPRGLSVEHYIGEAFSPLNPVVILSTCIIILLLGVSMWLYSGHTRLKRIVSFFILWFFIVLIPTTVFPLDALLQENRGYLSAVSFSIISGILLGKISSLQFQKSRHILRPYTIPVLVLLLVLFAYSAGTIQRNSVWKDGITLWSDAVRKSPLSVRTHHNLAFSYREDGETGAAIVEYQRTIDLDPTNKEAHYNLGTIFSKLKLRELAIYEFKKALEIDPNFHKARNNLGMTYWKMGNPEMAIEEFKKILVVNSGYILPRINLGRIYEEMGMIDKAYREFEAAKEKALSIPGEEVNAKDAIDHMERLKRNLGRL